MQTNAIKFNEAEQAQPQLTLEEQWKEVSRVVNEWLDTKSEFYSRIAEFSVTRRLVLRMNAVTACGILFALAIEQQPVVALVSGVCAAWLIHRLNKGEKKGGRR